MFQDRNLSINIQNASFLKDCENRLALEIPQPDTCKPPAAGGFAPRSLLHFRI